MQILFVLISLFTFTTAPANIDDGKMEKVTIETSARCEMCKVTIEKALYELDGVKKAELDLVTKKVKVKYDARQVDLSTLRQTISAVGYQADAVPARPKAVAALPDCCKPEVKACKKSGKSCCAAKKTGV